MENPEITKIKDIRQSEGWAAYQESIGWKIIETQKGTKVALMRTPIGKAVKIQRPDPIDYKELEEIETICKEDKALFVRIEPSLKQNLKLLEEKGFYLSPYPLLPPTTIFIDLRKDENELWDKISRSGKYSVRRAQREGAKIEFFKNPDEKTIALFEEVAKETAKIRNFGFSPFEELKTKVKEFGDDSYIAVAKEANGTITGANFYLGYKGNIWYMHGGTTAIGRKSKAGYDLVWQSFLYFKKEGYEFLDLEGKDDKRFPNFTKEWGGFSHFKEKFGGIVAEFPYPQVKIFSPALKLLEKFYGKIPF